MSSRYCKARSASRKHADEYGPKPPILLAVDQEFGEGETLRVAPELADPVGAVEVGEPEDMDEFGANRRGRAWRRWRSDFSLSSKVTAGRLMRLAYGVLKDLARTLCQGQMVAGANVTLRRPEKDSNPPA